MSLKKGAGRDHNKQEEVRKQYPLAGVAGPRVAAVEAGPCFVVHKVTIYKGPKN
jgi:hypothetical protein